MSFADKVTSDNLHGEALNKYEDKFTVFIVTSIIIFNLIPLCVYLLSSDFKSFDLLAKFAAFWYIWFTLMTTISLKNPKFVDTITMPLLIQIITPMIIGAYILKKHVLKKYPNSKDPEEILKFRRKQKIKSIL